MVDNHFIKCQVCGAITRIRLQIGFLKEHPINVACKRCGTSINGKVTIGQDTLCLKYAFENADEETKVRKADYVVECSGEFPTLKPSVDDYDGNDIAHTYNLSPFMRFSRCSKYEGYAKTIAELNRLQERWAQYKRVIALYERGDRKYLLNEIWKILPKDQFQLYLC